MNLADNLTQHKQRVTTKLGRRYSQFVGWMKVVLPLISVALIALIIGWPSLDGEGDGFRLSIADLALDADGDLGITRARFAGTYRFDRPFLVTAEHATQDANGFDVFALDTLQADMTLANGKWATITAAKGQFERSARILDLVGPISVFTDVGYEIHAEKARLDFEKGTITSFGPIRGHGPIGSFSATRGATFFSDTESLTLNGNVKVKINPRMGK